jgi:hypothetical protein
MNYVSKLASIDHAKGKVNSAAFFLKCLALPANATTGVPFVELVSLAENAANMLLGFRHERLQEEILKLPPGERVEYLAYNFATLAYALACRALATTQRIQDDSTRIHELKDFLKDDELATLTLPSIDLTSTSSGIQLREKPSELYEQFEARLTRISDDKDLASAVTDKAKDEFAYQVITSEHAETLRRHYLSSDVAIIHTILLKLSDVVSKSLLKNKSTLSDDRLVYLKRYFIGLREAIANDPQYSLPDTIFPVAIDYLNVDSPCSCIKYLHMLSCDSTRCHQVEGAAGMGKSSLLSRIAQYCVDSEPAIVPFFINLGSAKGMGSAKTPKTPQWVTDFLITHDRSAAFDYILQNAISAQAAPVTSGFFSDIAGSLPTILIVDGLNEIKSNEARKKIVEILELTVKEKNYPTSRCSCIIGSRSFAGLPTMSWERVKVAPVSSNYVSGILADRKISWNGLPDVTRKLLQIPFFLNLFLKNKNTLFSETRSKLLEQFFLDILQQNHGKLEFVASAAYSAYLTTGSRNFRRSTFISDLARDEELFETLVQEGVLNLVSDGDMLDPWYSFDHQTRHDYLAARVLSGRKRILTSIPGFIGSALDGDQWTPKIFQQLSFEKASPDVFVFTAEQLLNRNDRQVDAFMERVYDWDWLICLECIRTCRDQGSPISRAIEAAICSIICQKCFTDTFRNDDNDQIIQNALYCLTDGHPEDGAILKNQSAFREYLLHIDSEIKQKNPLIWYNKFSELFFLEADPNKGLLYPQEEKFLLTLIMSRHSIIGWATPNSLRNIGRLSHQGVKTLATLFDVTWVQECGDFSSTVRWRIVYALGGLEPFESADETRLNPMLASILAQALKGIPVSGQIVGDNKDSTNTRIGALRSMIEWGVRHSDNQCKLKIVMDFITESLKDIVINQSQDKDFSKIARSFAKTIDRLRPEQSAFADSLSALAKELDINLQIDE